VNGRILTSLRTYTHVPSGNLIYLSYPVFPGDEIVVEYSYSKQLDIGLTNWDCTKGDYIFYWKDHSENK